jgi:glycosyltransferase involved in cell wall biosynthesis
MGVGQSARSAAAAAAAGELGTSLRNINVTGPQAERDVNNLRFSEDLPYDVNIFHVNADQTDAALAVVGNGALVNRYNIGYWAWELEEFPDEWRGCSNAYSEIWVPSSFCQTSIAHKVTVPVLRIPHAISLSLSHKMDRGMVEASHDTFVLLTMFDMLSVFNRKNPIAVIQSFKSAFAGKKCAKLVVKVSHAQYFPNEMRKLREASAGYPIHIIDSVLPREDVNAILAMCDCFVSLHRSEGFGLAIAEAMYLGKPVITTAYSGNMDFTRPNNSFLVDYTMEPVGPGCAPYHPDCRWAEPCLESAIEQMRLVYESSEVSAKRAQAGAQFIRQFYSPEAIGRLIRERLTYIAQATGKPRKRPSRPVGEGLLADATV